MVQFLPPWQKSQAAAETDGNLPTSSSDEKVDGVSRRWNLGILSDALTDEVPGSVILLSRTHNRNEPLGLRHAQARTSASSLPSPYEPCSRSRSRGSLQSLRSCSYVPEKKRTKDGRFILEPQPEDSANDPLNWNQVRRDVALVSLGFYCMMGGGMTPLLAAGFDDVAKTYHVTIPQVALTTGLYMLGLGIGSVVASPTAILWGKRPVYLVAIVLFMLSAVWCALSPNYPSLVVARIVQGLAVSPVECLPSATIAEIFFLHERAYRLGIYTLLLLGGKNLVPLVSAAIVQSLGWRWVFWITACVVAFCFFLIFLFVPETFWDRRPLLAKRHMRSRSTSPGKQHKNFHLASKHARKSTDGTGDQGKALVPSTPSALSALESSPKQPRTTHVGFADSARKGVHASSVNDEKQPTTQPPTSMHSPHLSSVDHGDFSQLSPERIKDIEKANNDVSATDSSSFNNDGTSKHLSTHYTDFYRSAPPKSYIQSLKPWNGRLVKDKWIHVMLRPFILFAYPAVLWSSLVYSLAIGWLIVLSESVAHVYRDGSYHFTALQVGLVYTSPFIGGILGTAVAGKISDFVVRYMARKNDGVYEPEFRLLMALPIAISTVIGLIGFGWSAEEKDKWIVPTVFFGVTSFGCSLASTTAITFVVDSYRMYAGEALVTLNFSKNVFHGFVFSLFFTHWLEADGAKKTFIGVGCIQLVCMLFSIPMYIYGKRARMWTVRKNFMEKF